MAHTKSGGSTKLGRESRSKRLGIKVFAGQGVKSGDILVRQRGTKWHPGKNVRLGKDDTIYAIKAGVLKFTSKQKEKFDGKKKKVTIVNIT